MILSDNRILEEIEKRTIKIDPYKREYLGSNSYDVHLGKYLATYKDKILDAKKHNEIIHFEIPKEVSINTSIHLDRKQVQKLLPILQHFVETGELS